MARNLVQTGDFGSKVIEPGFSQLTVGYNTHEVVYFTHALFFMLGDISYFSAKMANIFFGVLMVFPIFLLTKEMYDEITALISVVLISAHPLVVFFSSIPWQGSEMIATLYLFTALYFLLLNFKDNRMKHAVVSALFTFLVFGARRDYFYVFIVCLPFLILILSIRKRHKATSMSKDRKNDANSISMHMRVKASLASTYRRIDVKHLLFCFALVFIFGFMWRTGFLLNFFFISMPIYLILLGISIKKRIGRSLLNIDVYTLTLFFLLILHLSRAFSFYNYVVEPAAQISDQVTVIISPTLQIVSFNLFQERFSIIWSWYYSYLTELVFFLALLSLSNWNKLRNSICFFIFPLSYSVFISLTTFPLFTFQDQYRWLLSSFFFLLVTAAFALRKILAAFSQSGLAKYTIAKAKRARVLRTLPLLLVLMISFSYFFYAQYERHLNIIRSGGLFSDWNWKPGVDWISENTSSSDVLMMRKPREWSWYTERVCVLSGSQDLNISQLREAIKEYKVDYLVVDGTFYWSHEDPELKALYANPNEGAKANFVPVFVSTSNPKIVIYDVRALL